MTIVLSLIKAVPLFLLGLILLVTFGTGSGVDRTINEFFGITTGFWPAALFFVMILTAAASLLLVQIWSAATYRPRALLSVSGIMTVLDIVGFLDELTESPVGSFSVVLYGAVASVQTAIFVWALEQWRSKRRTSAGNV